MIPGETASNTTRHSRSIASFTPPKLFSERAASFWIAVWRCWRTVLDWTVCLYILLPGTFIAAGMYRDFMRDPPSALAEFPLYPVLLLMTLLQLAGKYRTFAEAGDGLFLHRNPRWRRAFGMMGFAYGGASRLLVALAAAAALSPVLLPVFGLSSASLAAFVVYFAAAGLFWTMVRDLVALSWRGWRRWAALLPAGAAFAFGTAQLAAKGASNPGMTLAFGGAFLAAACLILLQRLRKRGTLLHEIAVESEIYAAFVSWILMDTLEKKPVPRRSKPILFSRSQPLLKHRNKDVDRLADSWMKSVVRRPDMLKQLFYFLWAGAAAIALSPIPLAVFVWLALPFLVAASLRRQWKQWMAEPYLALFDWQDSAESEASRKAISRLALPLVQLWALLIAVRIGLSIGGWAWLAVGAAPVAAYYWLRTASGILSSFSASRRQRE